MANTLHAFGITAPNGTEILIHIGLDTVELNGHGFKVMAKACEKVKKMTPIIEIDRDDMKQKRFRKIYLKYQL
jgi:phosphotransferase system IIA component